MASALLVMFAARMCGHAGADRISHGKPRLTIASALSRESPWPTAHPAHHRRHREGADKQRLRGRGARRTGRREHACVWDKHTSVRHVSEKLDHAAVWEMRRFSGLGLLSHRLSVRA